MRNRNWIALSALMVFLTIALCGINLAEAKDWGECLLEGNQARDAGRYKEALEAYSQALKLTTDPSAVGQKAGTLLSIGIVCQELSQYEKALDYYKQSLAIFRKLGLDKLEARNLNNIGVVYYFLGQNEKALDYHQKALAINKKIGEVQGEAASYRGMGLVCHRIGQDEKALDYLQQALAINKKIGNLKGEAGDFGSIGNVYRWLGQYEKALDYQKQALVVHKKIGDLKSEGGDLANIGVVYTDIGQYEKALDCFKLSVAISKEIGDRNTEGRVRASVGASFLALGKLDGAEEELAASIKVFEAVREEVRSEKERTGLQGTMPDAYGHLAAARLAMGKPESAFEAIEHGRAKSFLELLGTRETARRRGKEKTSELARMESDLSKLRQERVQVSSAPAGSKTRAVGAVDQSISEVDKRRMDLVDQMRRSDPELGSLVSVDHPSLKEIQSLLSPDTLMVEYFHLGEYTVSKKKVDELWVFLIHRDGFEFKAVNVTRSDLENTLDRYAALLSDSTSQRSEIDAVSAKLHGWLIDPIQAGLGKLQPKTLIVVPWGGMFKIPFGALAPEKGEPLAVKQNIVVAPSAGVYRYVEKKRALGHDAVLALGNPQTALSPLPGAEQEVRDISSLFKKSAIRTGAQATEKLVKADSGELGRPDVIHLACHGIFNDKVPELSYLALTPDQQNDGKLEMHEIFDLDWKGVSLVTLSACSSAKGKLGAGDDLVGLTRAFIFAGTPSVLSSLWDVDDEATRTLMVSFYKNYVGGMSKPESLRQAQLAMMKTPKWSHPNYWSGFVLFGDWE